MGMKASKFSITIGGVGTAEIRAVPDGAGGERWLGDAAVDLPDPTDTAGEARTALVTRLRRLAAEVERAE